LQKKKKQEKNIKIIKRYNFIVLPKAPKSLGSSIYITLKLIFSTVYIYDNENKSITNHDNFTYKNQDNIVKL